MTFDQFLHEFENCPGVEEQMSARELAEAAWDAARQDMQNNSQQLTCVFCGHVYPPGTPPSNHDALRAHIKECKKHPLYQVMVALKNLLDSVVEVTDMDYAEPPMVQAVEVARKILGGSNTEEP